MSSDPTNQAFVFSCQAGSIETEASVLAASLRNHLGERWELIAMIPGPASVMGQVSPLVIDFLTSLHVRIQHYDNPIHVSNPRSQKGYFLTNKIFCLQQARTDAETVVFLDSDQICHSPFNWSSEIVAPFFAPRVGYAGANIPEEVWQQCFRICDTEPPRIRFRIPAPESGTPPLCVPPWFNSGFIAIEREWIPEITSLWLDFFKRIDAEDCLGKQRYFTEQLALAIAVAKSGICYQLADPAHIAKSLLHYFSLERLASLPHFVSVVRHLVKDFPSLEEVVLRSFEWAELLGLQTTGALAGATRALSRQPATDHEPSEVAVKSATTPPSNKVVEPSDVKQVTKNLPWMSLQQAEFLTQHLHRHRLARCLELGVLHGVSTCYLAAAVQKLNGHVVAIDLAGNANLKPGAEELLETLGLQDLVTIERVAEGAAWRMMEWLELPQQPVFDLAYIDVSHTWDTTGFLFFLTDRFVRPGGWLLFDDIRSYKLKDDPVGRRSQNYTQKQLDVCQVGKVWDLLVTQHPSYSNFMERGNWGLCQKVR
jgi:predicted O-methyltransferase YrrM